MSEEMGEYIKGTCEVKPLTINVDTAEANHAIEKQRKNIEDCHEALKLFKADMAIIDHDKFIKSFFKLYLNSGKITELFLSFINKLKEDKKA